MVVTIFVRYTLWHYTHAPHLLFRLWMNFLWYLGHIFSVDSLARSLFAPYRRIIAKRTKRWDLEDLASAALANLISRIIGAIMRVILILIGRLLQLVVLTLGATFYVGWFILPVLIALTFIYGFQLIFLP